MSGVTCSKKRIVASVLLILAALLYAIGFMVQEGQKKPMDTRLELARPVPYYRILTGYLHQIAAELIFIRTNVFIGHATMLNKPLEPDGAAIAQNCDTAVALNPRFLAPYFLAQAFLPELSPELARRANSILEKGITAYPADIPLRFNRAANFFLWLNDPLKASQALAETAQLPEAPPLFAQLADMFATPEGVLKAGHVSLIALRNSEKDATVREKYRNQIINYERAIKIQSAIDTYRRETGKIPTHLEQLVPVYLQDLPVFDKNYRVVYNPPYVQLQTINAYE